MKNKRTEKILKILEKWSENQKKPTVKRVSLKNNAFKTLITCLLSLRTQDKNTEKTSKLLFSVADTPEKIAKLPLKKIEKLIYSSGYYKNKAKIIKHVSKEILEKYKGKVPSNREELLKIKGVGPKTANIVLCFSFNKNVIPVDTHVHIISNRLGLVKTKKPEETEKELEKVIPKKYWRKLNTIFVLFGQKVCITRLPKCFECPLEKLCPKIGVKKAKNKKINKLKRM